MNGFKMAAYESLRKVALKKARRVQVYIEVENHETDLKGRLIILRAKIDEFRFIFTNVYAPNNQRNAVRIF